ncbi:alpha/beta fold hydrolase [Devosia sp. CAU 1758]
MYQPLVFLPGLICDHRLWRDIIDGLSGNVAPMVADLRLDDTIAAMAARTLAAAPPRFALSGLSMGGYVALEIMRQAPERVTHLALFDTSARADTEERRETRRKGIAMIAEGKFIGVSRGLLGQLVAPHHLGTPLADEVQAMSERVGGEVYISQQKAITGRVDSLPMLKDISVPTLVGVGELDKMTPLDLAKEMAASIPGAELVQFPDAAHLPTIENPGPVVEAMKRWLKK